MSLPGDGQSVRQLLQNFSYEQRSGDMLRPLGSSELRLDKRCRRSNLLSRPYDPIYSISFEFCVIGLETKISNITCASPHTVVP